VIDVMILIFPLPILWKLKLALTKKIHLILIFVLGGFVVVCSTARLPTLYHMKKSQDPSCMSIMIIPSVYIDVPGLTFSQGISNLSPSGVD